MVLQECAKRITMTAGYCLSAVALIGSKRKQNPTDLQGWRGALKSVEALTQGALLTKPLSQVTSLFSG